MQVITYPADILHERAAVVPAATDDVRRLAAEMIEIMRLTDGVGLAAPQVGVLQRVFVTGAAKDDYRVFVNPEIVQRSSRTTRYEESCLSLPEVFADVHRPVWVRVRARDESGAAIEGRFAGLLARVFQHELDHLNGYLFIDHLSRKKKARLMARYERRYDRQEPVRGV